MVQIRPFCEADSGRGEFKTGFVTFIFALLEVPKFLNSKVC